MTAKPEASQEGILAPLHIVPTPMTLEQCILITGQVTVQITIAS